MRTRIKTLGFSLLLPAIAPLAIHAQNHDTSLASSQAARSQNLQFEHLSSAQGLSHNHVKCILQDSRGFLWFGTQNGLNRYDGYAFKVFKHDPEDPTTISDNFIWRIYEDSFENLWIGTANGLNKFDHATETFTRYLHDPNNPYSLSGDIVKAIHEDRAGTLWIGTWGITTCTIPRIRIASVLTWPGLVIWIALACAGSEPLMMALLKNPTDAVFAVVPALPQALVMFHIFY